MDETARGIGGFLARRWRAATLLLTTLRFVLFYLTTGRRVRRRYEEAQRAGRTIWLDHGPFAGDDEAAAS